MKKRMLALILSAAMLTSQMSIWAAETEPVEETEVLYEEAETSNEEAESPKEEVVKPESADTIMSSDDRFTFVLDDDGNAVIVKYVGSPEVFTLICPREVAGHPVTAVGDGAFAGVKSTSIVFTDSIKTVGASAFEGCDELVYLVMPGVTSIGKSAFKGTSKLEEVLFSEGLTTIPESAFEDSGIKKLYLPSTLTKVEENAVSGCSDLSDVYFPDPDKARTGVEVENTGNLYWPSSYYYKAHSFAWSDTYKYSYDKANNTATILEYHINADVTDQSELQIPSTLGGYNVTRIDGLGGGFDKVVVPEGVKEIGENAFDKPIYKEIVLPSSLRTIEEKAFYGCNLLEKVEIKSGLTTIGRYAFQYCKKLESVEIPDTVTSIGERAFYGCTDLKKAVIKANITALPQELFLNDTALSEVELPTTLQSLGDDCFNGCSSLTGIYLPANLISIGGGAFRKCYKLKTVTIPAKVTQIGGFAFDGDTNLKYAYIPKSVTSIGYFAFNNSGLIKVYYEGTAEDWAAVEKNNAKIPVGGVVYNSKISDMPDLSGEEFLYEINDSKAKITGYCGKAKSVVIPSQISEGEASYPVTCIGQQAFENAKIDSVILPDSVTAIEDSAFAGSSLKTITLSKNLKSIEDCAFKGSSLKSITFPEGLQVIGINALTETYVEELVIPRRVSKICDGAFRAMYALKSVKFEGTPETFLEGVFANTGLESIDWPAGLVTIPSDTFCGCENLKTVKIPSGVTRIDTTAFKDCTSLENIELPAALTSLGSSAFSGCTALKSIEIPDKVAETDKSVFSGCTSLMKVKFSAGMASVPQGMFSGCTNLSEIHFGSELGKVLQDAFKNCTALSNGDVYFAKDGNAASVSVFEFSGENAPFKSARKHHPSDADIDKYKLDLKSGLKYTIDGDEVEIIDYVGSDGNLVIPDEIEGKNVTKICSFEGNEKIISAVIGKNVTEGICFNNCSNLKKAVINASVKELDMYAFYNCSMLKEVTLPANLTGIGDSAFYGCTRLLSIDIPDTVDSIGSSAFEGCTCLDSVKLPAGITRVPLHCFKDCSSLESINISRNVKVVGDSAFIGCTNLKSVVLPASVNEIAGYAFSGTGVKKVYYRGNDKADITISATENDALLSAEWVVSFNGPDSISFKETEIVISAGESQTVDVVTDPEDAGGDIVCKSFDESVATLSYAKGTKKLTTVGKKSGVSRIEASCAGVTGSFYVYVRQGTPTASWDGREYLVGLVPGAYYVIDGRYVGDVISEYFVADKNGRLQIVRDGVPMLNNWFENTHTIVCVGETEKLYSLPQTIEVGEKEEVIEPGGGGGTGTVESDMNRYDPVIDVLDENNNPVTLTLWVKKSVSFNNALHKTNFDKDKRKWTRDVTVSVNCSISAYADPVVKLKNNKVVQVKAKKIPSVYLSFKVKKGVKATKAQKKVIKKLNKQLKKQGFAFVINPSNLGLVTLQPKYNKKFTKVTKLSAVIGDRTVKLSKKDFGYEFAADGTWVRVYAKGKNYIGDKTIPIDTK